MKKFVMGWGFLALCVASAPVAMADPLCSGGGGFQLVNQVVTNGQVFSGNGLFGGSNGCTINGIDFSNWQIAPNTGYAGGGNFLNVTISGVDATGTLSIATNMSAGNDIEIEFSVTPGITSDILSVGGVGGVNEVVCTNQMVIGNASGVGSCAFVGGTTLGTGSVSSNANSSTTIIVSPSSTDWIFKDISTSSEVSQQFGTSAVPEPMTLSMMGIGLLGLGLFGRRLRK